MAECGGAGQKGQDMAQGTPGVPHWSYRLCLYLEPVEAAASLKDCGPSVGQCGSLVFH